MKCLIVFGPPASGKMTVGRAIAKKTGYKLLHNHMTIDLILNFFEWGTPEFQRLDKDFRFSIMQEFAKSNQSGLIFTYMWEFNPEDAGEEEKYIREIENIFDKEDAETVFLELECSLEERLKRNKTALRLEHKPSKRNVELSEKRLIDAEKHSRFNAKGNELGNRKHLKVNNEKLTPEEVAERAIEYFKL